MHKDKEATQQQNCDAFEYALKLSEKIIPFTSPVLNTFGLSTFGYKKVLKDGRYLFLSTNQNWLKHHITTINTHGNFFKNAMHTAGMMNGFHRVLWPHTATDHFLEALHYWDMWNGLNFYKQNTDSIELWTFSTSVDRYQDPNAYLSIMNHLERFIIYFNARAAEMINFQDKADLAICNDGHEIFSSVPSSIEDKNLIEFFDQTTIKQFPIYTNEKLIYLSTQESSCLKLLAEGKSAKEIARILNLSYRTVESYLAHIKLKVGDSCKSALISKLNETFARIGYKDSSF